MNMKVVHFIVLFLSTASVLYLQIKKELGKNLLGTCNIKAISNLPYLDPLFILIYLVISANSIYLLNSFGKTEWGNSY